MSVEKERERESSSACGPSGRVEREEELSVCGVKGEKWSFVEKELLWRVELCGS